MHHKANFCHTGHKLSYHLSRSGFPVLDRKRLLKIKSDRLGKLLVMALLLNLAPIRLVGLLKHRFYWTFRQVFYAGHLLQCHLSWQEVFLNGAHYLRENVCVEINDAIQVQFRRENVEEDVLAVALKQFLYLGDQLVKHRERLAGVALTWHHLPHT